MLRVINSKRESLSRKLDVGGGVRRLLAHAGLESIADDAIRTVLPIVAVVHLLAGGAYLGVLNALSFVWFLVAHRMIGRWVDRLGGGRAVLVGAVLRTLVTMALLAALLQGTLNPVGLLLVAVALGLGDALATTSFGVLVPQTLGVDRVTAYYSHHEMVAAITRCLAPLLVAWLLGVASPAAVAGWAGALYLVALLVLGRASTVRASSPVPVVDGPADRGSRFGLRHVLRTPGLGGTTLATALQNGAAMATGTVLPLLVIRELGLPAHAVPLLAAVAAAGALLGARLAPRARARWGAGSARWVAAVIAAMVAVLLVAVPALCLRLHPLVHGRLPADGGLRRWARGQSHRCGGWVGRRGGCLAGSAGATSLLAGLGSPAAGGVRPGQA